MQRGVKDAFLGKGLKRSGAVAGLGRASLMAACHLPRCLVRIHRRVAVAVGIGLVCSHRDRVPDQGHGLPLLNSDHPVNRIGHCHPLKLRRDSLPSAEGRWSGSATVTATCVVIRRRVLVWWVVFIPSALRRKLRLLLRRGWSIPVMKAIRLLICPRALPAVPAWRHHALLLLPRLRGLEGPRLRISRPSTLPHYLEFEGTSEVFGAEAVCPYLPSAVASSFDPWVHFETKARTLSLTLSSVHIAFLLL